MSRKSVSSLPTMPHQPDVSLPTMSDDVITTPVPLAVPPQKVVSHDFLQQDASPDLPQQDVSPNMPQHYPLPQRVHRPNPSFRWKMSRRFPHLCPLPTSYLRRSHPRKLIYLGIVDYLVFFNISVLLVWIFLLS
ncbi:hypothetical protein V6N12_069266 [Hibiscus sabdariffa]|uniref:Uncharacterized protein n=1 Tax=Hibiscus sabdariffa TaxID=183260 RepID=A0ABR2FDB3_9ROSI